MENDITQDQLDGLVTVAELPKAVGYINTKEKEASVKGGLLRTYRVVDAEKIAETRTKKATKNEGRYLTLENARTVLPPSYSAREIDGDVYAALHHPPTVEIRGYRPEQVETFRERLADYREEKERQRKARAEDRNALLQRWLSGDEHVAIHFTDTAAVSAPSPVAGNRVVARPRFTREEGRHVEVDTWDPVGGRWVPETA